MQTHTPCAQARTTPIPKDTHATARYLAEPGFETWVFQSPHHKKTSVETRASHGFFPGRRMRRGAKHTHIYTNSNRKGYCSPELRTLFTESGTIGLRGGTVY
jgi:hypothetical protein